MNAFGFSRNQRRAALDQGWITVWITVREGGVIHLNRVISEAYARFSAWITLDHSSRRPLRAWARTRARPCLRNLFITVIRLSTVIQSLLSVSKTTTSSGSQFGPNCDPPLIQPIGEPRCREIARYVAPGRATGWVSPTPGRV